MKTRTSWTTLRTSGRRGSIVVGEERTSGRRPRSGLGGIVGSCWRCYKQSRRFEIQKTVWYDTDCMAFRFGRMVMWDGMGKKQELEMRLNRMADFSVTGRTPVIAMSWWEILKCRVEGQNS